MKPEIETTLGQFTLVLDRCWVCSVRFKDSKPPGPANREDHHIYPRNAGGEDGPQVSLCEVHHSTAHKMADRLHSRKPFTDLLAGEDSLSMQRIAWLAACIVKAERAAEGDPNKKFINSFKLSAAETAMLERLQKYYRRGRQEVLRAALLHLYKATFHD